MPARNPPIRRHALLACEPFSPRLSAARVAGALAAGLLAAGAPEPDAVELPGDIDDRGAAALLERAGFRARMLASRAVIVAVSALSERTLPGSAAFEVATLARQNGVPCYAVAAHLELNEFDLRILDLQLVLHARGVGTLRTAGERLAGIV
ncbi:MAG TPA: glycerate kinase [Solirubrobacteraceae bacterium]|nr:glycerate kinase [Solirubrobacteraceae bacterium]